MCGGCAPATGINSPPEGGVHGPPARFACAVPAAPRALPGRGLAPPDPQGCSPCAAFAARAPAVGRPEGRAFRAPWAVHMSPQGDCGQCSSGKDCPRNPPPPAFFQSAVGKRSASGRRQCARGQLGWEKGHVCNAQRCAHVPPDPPVVHPPEQAWSWCSSGFGCSAVVVRHGINKT